jgi:cyclic beta-1,2-glucan synthetase
MLNPISHTNTLEKVTRYKVEPYVIAADIYSVSPHTGRGGWTWYTGSSGWIYRLGVEAILGINRVGNSLRIDPCIPSHWPGYKVDYLFGNTHYKIDVKNPNNGNRGVAQILLDGNLLPNTLIPLANDGQLHEVRVMLE